VTGGVGDHDGQLLVAQVMKIVAVAAGLIGRLVPAGTSRPGSRGFSGQQFLLNIAGDIEFAFETLLFSGLVEEHLPFNGHAG